MYASPTLHNHQVYSTNRVNELVAAINSLTKLPSSEEYCVFATGAFARNEANAASGIDLFLLTHGLNTGRNGADVTKNLLVDDLTQLLQKINLAGEVVAAYAIEDLGRYIGAPQDEQRGYRDARMLFLLESVPVHNPLMYKMISERIARTYLEDYHQHTHELPTVFLLHDIIRYWKTVCLTSEHEREYLSVASEHHGYVYLRSIKFIYSKKLACYSFVLLLLLEPRATDAERIQQIIRMKPVERLLYLAAERPAVKYLVEETLDIFTWFLDLYNQSPADLQYYINDRDKRKVAFDRGKILFGQKIYDLIIAVTQRTPEVRKYLLA